MIELDHRHKNGSTANTITSELEIHIAVINSRTSGTAAALPTCLSVGRKKPKIQQRVCLITHRPKHPTYFKAGDIIGVKLLQKPK